ncbi:MAG: hypothetical protein AAF352_09460 [Pseudomonadota bacterium]
MRYALAQECEIPDGYALFSIKGWYAGGYFEAVILTKETCIAISQPSLEAGLEFTKTLVALKDNSYERAVI